MGVIKHHRAVFHRGLLRLQLEKTLLNPVGGFHNANDITAPGHERAMLGFGDILKKRHIEPDLARYELHRVWVVEGVLDPTVNRRDIPGGRPNHIYSKRVFYLDEDSWQIVLTEDYDHDNQLWRVSEGHVINYYEVPVLWATLEAWYDLKARRYFVNGLDNRRNMYRFSERGNIKDFSPNALNLYVR